MAAVTDEQRRIVKTKSALRLLATGKPLRRGELFPKKPDERYEGWINRVLDRLVELGVIEAHGKSFSRYYQIADATDPRQLRQHAKDDEKVAQLLWPGTTGLADGEKLGDVLDEPDEFDEPAEPAEHDEPDQAEINAVLLRLMAGTVEKLDRMETALAECREILQEFKS